ncbi:MAG TPA: disulfide bond formation protein B [Burkholderiaceae bacterium]|jgi:disulfide bond formation protein DsbB|nr:disulfide bond formation protein B [Burkholderiaceae bacterium]
MRKAAGAGVFALTLALSIGAVGAALVTQHVFDMQPCPWCVLQRLIFVALALVAVLGLLWTSRLGRRVAAVIGVALAALGVAAALWQHAVAAKSASCNLTLADRIVSGLQLDALLPQVFAATASCAEAAVQLFGVPYEYWSLALFGLLGLSLVMALLRRRR